MPKLGNHLFTTTHSHRHFRHFYVIMNSRKHFRGYLDWARSCVLSIGSAPWVYRILPLFFILSLIFFSSHHRLFTPNSMCILNNNTWFDRLYPISLDFWVSIIFLFIIFRPLRFYYLKTLAIFNLNFICQSIWFSKSGSNNLFLAQIFDLLIIYSLDTWSFSAFLINPSIIPLHFRISIFDQVNFQDALQNRVILVALSGFWRGRRFSNPVRCRQRQVAVWRWVRRKFSKHSPNCNGRRRFVEERRF